MSFYDTYDARVQGLSSTYKQAYVDSDLLALASYIFLISPVRTELSVRGLGLLILDFFEISFGCRVIIV